MKASPQQSSHSKSQTASRTQKLPPRNKFRATTLNTTGYAGILTTASFVVISHSNFYRNKPNKPQHKNPSTKTPAQKPQRKNRSIQTPHNKLYIIIYATASKTSPA